MSIELPQQILIPLVRTEAAATAAALVDYQYQGELQPPAPSMPASLRFANREDDDDDNDDPQPLTLASQPPNYESLVEQMQTYDMNRRSTIAASNHLVNANATIDVAADTERKKYVACRVCQRIISLNQIESRIITCNHCHNDTAISPAPEGKMFVRCHECKQLLERDATQVTVECMQCRATFVLEDLMYHGLCVTCTDCNGTFHVPEETEPIPTKCRRCKKKSTLWVKLRVRICCIFGIIFIISGVLAIIIAMSIGLSIRENQKNLAFYTNLHYIIIPLLFLVGLLLLLRVLFYLHNQPCQAVSELLKRRKLRRIGTQNNDN